MEITLWLAPVHSSFFPTRFDHSSHLIEVEADSIGDHNTFKPKSKVSPLIAVTDHCAFSPGTVTFPSDPASAEVETLPAYTVVYGAMCERRKWDGSTGEIERAVREKKKEYLREIMPK